MVAESDLCCLTDLDLLHWKSDLNRCGVISSSSLESGGGVELSANSGDRRSLSLSNASHKWDRRNEWELYFLTQGVLVSIH